MAQSVLCGATLADAQQWPQWLHIQVQALQHERDIAEWRKYRWLATIICRALGQDVTPDDLLDLDGKHTIDKDTLTLLSQRYEQDNNA